MNRHWPALAAGKDTVLIFGPAVGLNLYTAVAQKIGESIAGLPIYHIEGFS